jgi:sterol 24-C-methyltransferase
MENLGFNYLKLFREFRRRDLVAFCDTHHRLHRQALLSNDYGEVTRHYYGLMTSIIETYYGSSFHFCPPEHPRQRRAASLLGLHRRLAEMMGHAPGRLALDVGCGLGAAARDISAHCGGRTIGVTLGRNEVAEGARLNRQAGLERQVSLVAGDFQRLPFGGRVFDCAYAIYSLKYFPDLRPIFREVQRVLKEGGTFLVYDLVKTERFDPASPAQARLVGRLEYLCGMPPLHTNGEMIEIAGSAGLECLRQTDVAGAYPWYHCFVESPLFVWLLYSRLIRALIGAAEKCRLLPRGFARFNDAFLAGTVRCLIEAGRTGILSGSYVLQFRKPL